MSLIYWLVAGNFLLAVYAVLITGLVAVKVNKLTEEVKEAFEYVGGHLGDLMVRVNTLESILADEESDEESDDVELKDEEAPYDPWNFPQVQPYDIQFHSVTRDPLFLTPDDPEYRPFVPYNPAEWKRT